MNFDDFLKVHRDHDGRRFLQAGRHRVYVGTEAECEDATISVCMNVSFFADDCRGACAGCGAPIVFRPYMPARPAKVCLECASVIVRGSARPA